ncbi:MAG: tetratricopeptide repeat protein [Candidatus Levybacteria bacterium]|nr:tetratricopeptide repeat protein [Candidatus Levybacteria bacterium]
MKNEVSAYLENISLLFTGILFLAFPLLFTIATTESFTLPKQTLLLGIVLITLLLSGAKMISDGKVKLIRTPFDLPLFIFGLIIVLSAVFSANRADSLTTAVPVVFAIISYFLVINTVKNASTLLFAVSSLVLGASLAAVVSILAYFKIYVLPFPLTHTQTFTTFGSLLDQAIYFALVLPLSLHFVIPLFKERISDVKGANITFAITSILLLMGLFVTFYQLIAIQRPVMLPFETGFQTAFAAISQDAGRTILGFLLGSGFGTYMSVFTKFKQAAFNLHPTLWSFTFLRSSSFILELLATTGFLGIASFVFLLSRIVKELKNTFKIASGNAEIDMFSISLLLAVIATIILPLSFIIQALVFFIIALFATRRVLHSDGAKDRFFEVELQFVAFKKGFIPLSTYAVDSDASAHQQTQEERSLTKFLPVSFFIIFLAFSVVIGFFVVNYVSADVIFQNSIIAASKNNSLETYNSEGNAINKFPFRDGFYRVYSKTNLALANSLAIVLANQQKTGTTSTQQTQQTIYNLIQQAISAGRQATTISPQTTTNWQNLSSVYRSLIGFGQNAESFAILASQQAIALDPNNPQQYLDLGGIYYQLGQWDNAQRQFQIAINLKADYANAYYNLGHTLEQKGDFQNALTQYQTVKTLVSNDPANLSKITAEIDTLQAKIGSTQQATKTQATQQSQSSLPPQQQPIEINQPATQLPEQKPQVKLPEPQTTANPTPSPSVAPTTATPTAPTAQP